MKIDKFVIMIILTVIVAYLFPQLGSENSPIPLDTIGSIGIAFIFFFYGVKLNPTELKASLKNWKLHLLVQLSTFLIFPLLVIALSPLIHAYLSHNIWLAFFFLAALPSTVSSSVVMVSIAKGNISSAIFNASISGLIGIALTPMWMGIFLNKFESDFDISSVYIKLMTEVLLPVILGLIIQKHLKNFVSRYRNALTLFDKSIILLIIYKNFSKSFINKVFSDIDYLDLLFILVLVLLLFIIVYGLIGWTSKRLEFSKENKITAQFCGTKKSLVHGTVFSKILFQNSPILGIILLPTMLFHALQILIISIIASKQAKL